MYQTIIERRVNEYEEIPKELLNNLDKMGVDTSSILNDFEVKYLSFIFRIDTNDFNLAGKKVGFLGSKRDFFNDEREWFYRGEKTGVGGSCLYILNATQKEESDGYDAAIVYWSKRLMPMQYVVKGLK